MNEINELYFNCKYYEFSENLKYRDCCHTGITDRLS